jgi:hypothetical protein
MMAENNITSETLAPIETTSFFWGGFEKNAPEKDTVKSGKLLLKIFIIINLVY